MYIFFYVNPTSFFFQCAVQDCEMHYMNAWLKRCVFNIDLNRESVSELEPCAFFVFTNRAQVGLGLI